MLSEYEMTFSDGRTVELGFADDSEAYDYAFGFAELMGLEVLNIRSVA